MPKQTCNIDLYEREYSTKKHLYTFNKKVYIIQRKKRIIECGRGSFGVSCNETCGHCRDVNQCLHTNGTCLTGCIAGFEGNLCKTRR